MRVSEGILAISTINQPKNVMISDEKVPVIIVRKNKLSYSTVSSRGQRLHHEVLKETGKILFMVLTDVVSFCVSYRYIKREKFDSELHSDGSKLHSVLKTKKFSSASFGWVHFTYAFSEPHKSFSSVPSKILFWYKPSEKAATCSIFVCFRISVCINASLQG